MTCIVSKDLSVHAKYTSIKTFYVDLEWFEYVIDVFETWLLRTWNNHHKMDVVSLKTRAAIQAVERQVNPTA